MTLYKLTEEVKTALDGRRPGQGSAYAKNAVMEVLRQVISEALKLEYFKVNLPSGEIVPEGLALASYDAVAVTTYKNVARTILPAMPVKLPKNMGVFHISRTDDIHNPFIPIPAGLTAMLKTEPLISDLLDQVGYEVHGKEIIYDRDITDVLELSPVVATVFMRLVVMDISNYGEFDVLPIPSDMEFNVITKAAEFLSQQKPEDKGVEPSGKPVAQ